MFIYEILVGKSPFQSSNFIGALEKIKNRKFELPDFLSFEEKDFINRFLQVNPEDRIEIKEALKHSFFTN